MEIEIMEIQSEELLLVMNRLVNDLKYYYEWVLKKTI